MMPVKSKSEGGCTNVLAELLHIALDTPVVPPEDIPIPEQAAVRAPADSFGPPPPPPPSYEYVVEPLVYFVGHGLCMALCLGILWLVLQAAFTADRLVTAGMFWAGLTVCSLWMIQGVRYGCSVRVYKGYLELRRMGPTRIVNAAEVSYFKEFHRESRSLRRLCLFMRTGERILLPRVHDPEALRRALVDAMRLEQAIA